MAQSRKSARRQGVRAAPVLLAMSIGLAGCADVPDALNPAEWYKSTADFFSGDDDQGQTARSSGENLGGIRADRGKPAPGADKPYPNLADVPKGLGGDSRGRRYAADAGPGQGAAVAAIGPRGAAQPQAAAPPPAPVMPKPAAAKTPPPPPAMRKAPVTAAPAPPKPAPQMAAAPPPRLKLKLKPPPAPVPPGTVRDTFRAKLAQRLPSKDEAALPVVDTLAPLTPGPLPTIIVSSRGVEIKEAQIAVAAAGSVKETAQRRTKSKFQFPDAAQTMPRSRVISASQPLASGTKVATILFGNNSSRLTRRDRQILRDVTALQREKGGTVRVVGHASSRTRSMDRVKHKMVNFQISLSRANAVVRELKRLGVQPAQISVAAVSDSLPKYYEVMPSGEAGNRRTEIFIDY